MMNRILKRTCVPCHPQTVERAVKLSIKSAQNVCGSNAKEVCIRTRFDSNVNMHNLV